jgi:outer membrane protein assembly factor BamB
MSTEPVPDPEPPPVRSSRLRIWPVVPLLVVLIAAQVTLRVMSEITPAMLQVILLGPILCIAGIGLWWLFASRAAWRDRFLGVLGFFALGIAGYFLADRSMRGVISPRAIMWYTFTVLPIAAIAATTAAVVLSRWGSRPSTIGVLIAAAAGFGYWDLVRYEGMSGDFKPSIHWRWQNTAEDDLLANLGANHPKESPNAEEPLGKVTWPQFRGAQRNGSVPGIVLDADWVAKPTKEIWRIKIGPGWSSFSVAANRLFTQELRGPKELVVCYDARTGAERWVHESPARFSESMGGVGPRATPTLDDHGLYAMGATGLLVRLDPLTGALKWERDLKVDARPEPPYWGFASSPLIVGDSVVVYAGGKDDKGILAYDRETGKPRWQAPAGDHSYSSPQLATLAGREVVLLLSNTGLAAVDASSGKPAWTYDWQFQNYRALQPLLVDGSSIVLGTGMGMGTRRIDVAPEKGGVDFKERWTTLDMKPDFNDFISYNGYLYGLDHNILCCVDLATGKKKWKNGRYGNGQLLFLPDAGQLLVLSESGDLVLIRATPDKLDEVARQKVLEGKTWNHPVLVGNRAFVRNAEEAACIELPVAGRSSSQPATPTPTHL